MNTALEVFITCAGWAQWQIDFVVLVILVLQSNLELRLNPGLNLGLIQGMNLGVNLVLDLWEVSPSRRFFRRVWLESRRQDALISAIARLEKPGKEQPG